MALNEGLRRRLLRAIIVQATAIGLVAATGVWAAAFLIENVLIAEALKEEATHYWKLVDENGNTPVPDTRNLTGYSAPVGQRHLLPEPLSELAPGHHELSSSFDFRVAYVTERMNRVLVLVFEGRQVRELSLVFGLGPLGLVLVVVYLGAWFSYRSARRALSPVEWLARQVNELDPESPDPRKFQLNEQRLAAHGEIAVLANALEALTLRVNQFVERERNFTRDASHELRSPLTVVRMAADMLLDDCELSERSRIGAKRIKRAAVDMVELVEAFLLLSREEEVGVEFEDVSVNSVIRDEVERARLLAASRPVEVRLVEDVELTLSTSDKVLSSFIGNLVRNAVDYTEEGTVTVRIGEGFVRIDDEGPGMEVAEVERAFDAFYRGRAGGRGKSTGYGVGLTIVRRLSERFGWPVTFKSDRGQGTSVTVELPDSASRPVAAPSL
ncbi:MAG: HAMP domain-containing histidine kinase [Chromatiales bacterium]|jgi:signal transduction histidine kinase|nr:HAMP domain-containing histidine kinase [Chromatiales bacterium]